MPDIVWPAAVVLAAALMLFPWFRGRKEPPPAPPASPAPVAQAATEADVESAVSTAAELMPDLSVKPQPLPIIDRDGKDRVLTYLVEAKKTNEFWFAVTQYQLGRGKDGTDPTNLDYTELVRAIDHASETRTPFGQAVTAAVHLNFGGGPVSGGVTIDNVPLDRIGQILGLLRGVVKLNVQRVDIAVRGWADGEKQRWEPPVKHLPDGLKRFPVLDPAGDSQELSLFYKKGERGRTITDPYTNADLPDLRAEYIRQQFVDPVVHRKDIGGNKCNVYVLHNEPLPGTDHPEWRKVQVWVMVYLTPEPKG